MEGNRVDLVASISGPELDPGFQPGQSRAHRFRLDVPPKDRLMSCWAGEILLHANDSENNIRACVTVRKVSGGIVS
jgi:hypothetical protein